MNEWSHAVDAAVRLLDNLAAEFLAEQRSALEAQTVAEPEHHAERPATKDGPQA